MKALCPFHQEDTPSFCYDRKRHRFHCFGCHTDADLLSAIMTGEGKTFLEAVQELFSVAKIPYSFGEMGQKVKRPYRYPTPESLDNDRTEAYAYLASRGISAQTSEAMGVIADPHGNIVFPYYDDNDTLMMVKYRPSHKLAAGEAKNWCQKDSDTTPLLFHMHRVNPSEPLLITEGEIDAMAAYESGYHNVVSVPLGAGNFHWIEENWDWLEQFPSIILCGDNDDPGRKMNKEASQRLGTWRTKIVQLPDSFTRPDGKIVRVSDVNEVLFYFGKEKVMSCIQEAKDIPVESVVDYSTIEPLNTAELDGIETGIAAIDEKLIRLFYGTTTVLTGITGSGKSSFLSQVVCQAINSHKDVWLYSKELPNGMASAWIDHILAGPRNVRKCKTGNGGEYYVVDPEKRKQIKEFYKGRLFVYKDECSSFVDDIKMSMEETVRKFGAKLLIIDNMSAVSFKCSADDRFVKQAEFINDLISFAKRFNVSVIVCVHPHKVDMTRRLDLMDIKGCGETIDLTHRVLSLYRVKPEEKEGVRKPRGDGWQTPPNPYSVELSVLKDRMTGHANEVFGLHYDVPSRRFFTSPKDYDFQYAWDQTSYNTALPYPVAPPPEEEEVYGTISAD